MCRSAPTRWRTRAARPLVEIASAAGEPPAFALDPETVPGFLSREEGATLRHWAQVSAPLGPIIEIGSYCGRSTLYLAYGAGKLANGHVFAVDHHRGSEEHQPGEAYHDPAHWDQAAGAMDTAPALRANLRRAGVEHAVTVMIGRSATLGRTWRTPAGMVFLDGGHAMSTALTDWRAWSRHVAPGGILAIHDVFHRPADGGRPPHEVFLRAVASGLFDPIARVGTLEILRAL